MCMAPGAGESNSLFVEFFKLLARQAIEMKRCDHVNKMCSRHPPTSSFRYSTNVLHVAPPHLSHFPKSWWKMNRS